MSVLEHPSIAGDGDRVIQVASGTGRAEIAARLLESRASLVILVEADERITGVRPRAEYGRARTIGRRKG